MSSVLKFWPIVATLLNFGVLWICWSLRQLAKAEVKAMIDALRSELTKADSEAEAALDDHETRIIRAEKDVEAIRQEIAQLPTKADLAKVEGKVDTVGSKVDRAGACVERIESYFLAKGVERS